ncbi:porin [Bordetella sp. 15P40C-2]|uniref:porin n=1 Tax=Bordetella sp. 15P40C-2 TaxID=2572246 RepID=UPI00132853B4|nr:porin [Bordetella sp. 15P40C-2]MVW73003.1 porin [Bordetella sp. 15P40C-2]
MKKTLLAAALLAGFAGVAQAETSVTLYGIIDTGLGYNKISGGSKHGIENGSRFGMINGVQNGSRWGLRGTEDLGDGLQAVFQLESGFNSGNGRSAQGGRLFGRQATVGLQSEAWGRLDLGRQTNIASKYFGSIDPFGAGFGQANIGMALSAANTVRYDNMVMYQTPSFSGFQVGVGYAFDAVSENDFKTNNNTRAITAGIRYVNGPLNVAFAYDQLNPGSDTTDANVKPRQYSIGASYDFEVVKLGLAYARTTDGWFSSMGVNGNDEISTVGYGMEFANNFKANSYMVGLSAPIGGASKLFGSWQMVDPSNDRLAGKGSGADEKMNIFSLGYTYDLSKRTNLYAYGSYAKNYAFYDDLKSTAVGVGVRHRF